jgi:hypothetical protein
MNKHDFIEVQKTLDDFMLCMRDFEAKMTRIIEATPEDEKDNSYYMYACQVRYMIRRANEAFLDVMWR